MAQVSNGFLKQFRQYAEWKGVDVSELESVVQGARDVSDFHKLRDRSPSLTWPRIPASYSLVIARARQRSIVV